MKIAIYGVSRAGKNYLIERIVNRLNSDSIARAFHLEGSTTLNDMADKKYGASFKKLPEEQKSILRKEFVQILKDVEGIYDVVFVDGHYAFISDGGYHVVFTEDDKNAYDAFFYLDTPSEMIVQFARNSTGEKKNTAITETNIKQWKSYEKYEMETVCKSLNKELIILDEHTDQCINFIESFVNYQDKELFNPMAIARKLVGHIQDDIDSFDNVLVMDCDKTLSENDVTYDFCHSLDIDTCELKSIFRNDRYTSYQFYRVAKLYGSKTDTDVAKAALVANKSLKLNEDLLDKICNETGDCFRLGITSGVYHIWSFSNEYRLFDALFGCSSFADMRYLITPSVKKEVVSLLKSFGKNVIAIGDSLIDIPMLDAADRGLIVAHEKLSNAVVDYFDRYPSTSIRQLALSKHKYAGVEVVEDFV